MKEKKVSIFNELFNLIPIILKVTKEFADFNIQTNEHKSERIKIELNIYNDIFNLSQKKWSLNIIYYAKILGELHYNEIKKLLKGISSQLLTIRLKMLVDKKILIRKVHNTTPVRVSYSLTEFGDNLCNLYVIIFSFWLISDKHQFRDYLNTF